MKTYHSDTHRPTGQRETETSDSREGSERFPGAQTPREGLLSVEEKDNPRQRGRNPDRRRHGARNQHKSKIFVRWLVDTFPQLKASTADDSPESDRPSRMVVDVAGGKGELAVRLCMCHRLRVVLVDPRPANPVSCYSQLVLPKLPKKWQQRFRERQEEHERARLSTNPGDANGFDDNSPSFLEHTLSERFQQLVMPWTEETLSQCQALQNVVNEASVLIGVHADGATEAVVDAALLYDKPFVVVPCCVFPNLFRQRFIQLSGEEADDTTSATNQKSKRIPVRTHEHFCQYLLEKDPRFQRTVLPFEGRNVAIWWDGRGPSSVVRT